MDGPLWKVMHRQRRIAMSKLRAEDLPHPDPGVYALYRAGRPVYLGLAGKQSLRRRLWGNHRNRGVSMTGSALRRNVAELLGIATSADIKSRRYGPTLEDAQRVVAWIDECEAAWIVCASPRDARELEAAIKAEWMPPLTKR